MERELTRFLEEPTQRNYFAARAAALRISPRLVALTDMHEIEQLVLAADLTRALDRLESLPPAAALSPRVHFLAAQIADEMHDVAGVELERFLFVVCLQALLATGDGSETSPYKILQTTDQQDVLTSLHATAVKHTLLPRGAMTLEVAVDAAGRQIWFDVTGLMPARKIRRRVAPRASRRKLAQK